MNGDDVVIERSLPEDRDAIMALATRALGWTGDERDRAFFVWKHEENPFGASPAWVARLGGEVVGFRTMLCWQLARNHDLLHCVRAVDTATDPVHQGRGIFRSLTLHALAALTEDGTDAVFNTPNDKSRPGYLKMGWQEVGRPSLTVVPRHPGSVLRMARSRAGAEKWSEPTTVGQPALELLAGLDERLLAQARPGERWATARSLEHLRWRYGFEPLHYRAIEVRGGWCIFRVRRRGSSMEVAVCEWFSDSADPRALRSLVRAAGDYAVATGLPALRNAALRLPRLGPTLVWRPLAHTAVPTLADLHLSVGDLELF